MSDTQPHILAVDDDWDVCDLFRNGLEFYGFRATCATDGQTALDLVEAHGADLAIVDRLLRGPIGGEALAHVLASRGVPVVMTSGAIDAQDRLAELPYPFLLKPFRWPQLVDLIQRTLPHRP